MLIVVLTPIVFGGLAINTYLEVSGFEKLIQEDLERQFDRHEKCQALSVEERGKKYLCSNEREQWATETAKGLDEAMAYWREKNELYTDIAIYVPLLTLALYFAGKWVWIGKVANEDTEAIKKTLWDNRMAIATAVLVLFLFLLSYMFWPERVTEALFRGLTKGVLIAVIGLGIFKLMKK